MSCPSRLSLDRWLDGEAVDSPMGTHVASCAACANRADALKAHRAAFALRASPLVFADGVLARRKPRRGWLLTMLVPAACTFLFFARPRGDDVGYKGGAPTAVAFVDHGGVVARHDPQRRYLPGDVVQVVALSARPAFVAVVDLEEGGASTVLFNAERALPAGRTPLPKAFELDGFVGNERIVVLFGDRPIDAPIEHAQRGEGVVFWLLR